MKTDQVQLIRKDAEVWEPMEETMTDYTNKDKMPAFTPPEVGQASGWHCWHEYNQHLKTRRVRDFVCCNCNGHAHFHWKATYDTPEGHGPYYPTPVPSGGNWVFETIGDTRYVCPSHPDAVIP